MTARTEVATRTGPASGSLLIERKLSALACGGTRPSATQQCSSEGLLDHLVGLGEQEWRNGERVGVRGSPRMPDAPTETPPAALGLRAPLRTLALDTHTGRR